MVPNSVWIFRVRPSRRRLSFIQSLHTRAQVANFAIWVWRTRRGSSPSRSLPSASVRPISSAVSLTTRRSSLPTSIVSTSPQPLLDSSFTTHSMSALPCRRQERSSSAGASQTRIFPLPVLDILVQDRRDAKAAKRFFRRLLKGLQYVPRVIITDKLRSYGVAQRHLLPDVEHRQSRYLNNRAENSHRPTRRRERQMQRFKSPGQAQEFLSAHAFIHGNFHPRRHLIATTAYRTIRSEAFSVWRQETCIRSAG